MFLQICFSCHVPERVHESVEPPGGVEVEVAEGEPDRQQLRQRQQQDRLDWGREAAKIHIIIWDLRPFIRDVHYEGGRGLVKMQI